MLGEWYARISEGELQIVDFTPLTERAETMVVQDLADETDVFMDFGHLSASTR